MGAMWTLYWIVQSNVPLEQMFEYCGVVQRNPETKAVKIEVQSFSVLGDLVEDTELFRSWERFGNGR